MIRIFIRTALVMLISMTLGCQQASHSAGRGNPVQVLDSLELKLAVIQQQTSRALWPANDVGFDSVRFFADLFRDVTNDPGAFTALRTAGTALDNDRDKRRYDLLYSYVLQSTIDHSSISRGLHDSILADYDRDAFVFNTPDAEFSDEVVSALRSGTEGDFRDIFDPGDQTADRLARFMRLRNQTAKRHGYNDYFGLTAGTTRLSKTDYEALLTGVRESTEEAFTALKSENNPAQVWDWLTPYRRILNSLDQRLPTDSQLVFVKRTLAGWGFNIDRYPIYFHLTEDTIRPLSVRVLTVDAPYDVRVVGNLKPGYQSFVRLFRAVGWALATASTDAEDAVFARFDEPAWQHGIEAFFSQACATKSWFVGVAGFSNGQATRLEAALTAQRLMIVRLLLTEAEFEYEMYTSANREPDQLYWRLFQKYVDLPVHEDLSPWASDPGLLLEPFSAYACLQGGIVGAQTIRYLEERYGNLIGNDEVRAFLVQNYLRFGSRYHWASLLERGTGRAPDPKQLVD